MKKLAILVLITAILTFAPAMASAHDDYNKMGDYRWKRFYGTYEMVASGICNHSTLGWVEKNSDFIPKEGSKIWAAHATMQGTFQFNRDKTGSFSATNYISLLPGGDPVDEIKHSQVSQGPIAGKFKYEITNNGEITITTGVGLVMNGMITADRKIITLVNANQILDLTGTDYKSYAIQNLIRVLIRVSD